MSDSVFVNIGFAGIENCTQYVQMAKRQGNNTKSKPHNIPPKTMVVRVWLREFLAGKVTGVMEPSSRRSA